MHVPSAADYAADPNNHKYEIIPYWLLGTTPDTASANLEMASLTMSNFDGTEGIIERFHYDDNQHPDPDEYEDPSAWHGTSGVQGAEAAAGRPRDAAAEGSEEREGQRQGQRQGQTMSPNCFGFGAVSAVWLSGRN
jgi:hypothetical protein